MAKAIITRIFTTSQNHARYYEWGATNLKMQPLARFVCEKKAPASLRSRMPGHLLPIALGSLMVALMLTAGVARAADFTVTTAQDLQNALTEAAANEENDTIYVSEGYYSGNFTYNSSGGHDLVIENKSGVVNTEITLDGGGSGRALSITSVGTGSNVVSGLSLSRDCGSVAMGALLIEGGAGSEIQVKDCRFISPANTSGMGLEITSGLNVTVTDCTVIGLLSEGKSGTGVSVTGVPGQVTVQDCRINSNMSSTPQGCGMRIIGADLVQLSGNEFADNDTIATTTSSPRKSGGGAYCQATTLELKDNIFRNNDPYGPGGGAYCDATDITLKNNFFEGNLATTYYFEKFGGGGAYCIGTNLTVNKNRFEGNAGKGAGMFCSGVTTTLSDNQFLNNDSPYSGGGFYCLGTVTLLRNSFRACFKNGFILLPGA